MPNEVSVLIGNTDNFAEFRNPIVYTGVFGIGKLWNINFKSLLFKFFFSQGNQSPSGELSQPCAIKTLFFIELKVIRNIYFTPLKLRVLFNLSDNVRNIFFRRTASE